jgi:ubiquinone/menaquinone biosynthesis C-methylase UbiE
MPLTDDVRVVEDNFEATEAWNGPLFDVWMQFREILTGGVQGHGEQALALAPPHEGDRVLDIGCGLGDTTLRLAQLIGPGGHAHGDVAERMIDTAIAEAAQTPDVARRLRAAHRTAIRFPRR